MPVSKKMWDAGLLAVRSGIVNREQTHTSSDVMTDAVSDTYITHSAVE